MYPEFNTNVFYMFKNILCLKNKVKILETIWAFKKLKNWFYIIIYLN